MEQTADKQIRTSLKEEIERTFIVTSRLAAQLNSSINCNCPGNRQAFFRSFVGHFHYLYSISNLETYQYGVPHLLNSCDTWFALYKPKATKKNVVVGLRLYRAYARYLRVQELIGS